MAELARAMDDLDPTQRDKVRVVFVSADPARDTPKAIRTWLDRFDERFVGLTGSPRAVDGAAADVDIAIERPPERKRKGNYMVTHGGQTILFDHEGTSRVL